MANLLYASNEESAMDRLMREFDTLEDDTPETPQARLERLRRETGEAAEPQFKERCPSCKGSGKFRSYTGRLVGECFKCKGKGELRFRTSPEQRTKAREQVQARKERQATERRTGFAEAYPNEWDWINAKAPTFGFAASMREAVAKWGSLSEKQLATVQRLMAQDAERDAQKARERAEREQLVTVVDLTRLMAAFDKALESGINEPSLRLGDFKFKYERGVIYVRRGERYIGKIWESRFNPVRACTPDDVEALKLVVADPAGQAKAYGFRTSSCSCCGRKLTNPVSVEMGIGPICADRFGF